MNGNGVDMPRYRVAWKGECITEREVFCDHLPNNGFFLDPPRTVDDDKELAVSYLLDLTEFSGEDYYDIFLKGLEDDADDYVTVVHFKATYTHLLEAGSCAWLNGIDGCLELADELERLARDIRRFAPLRTERDNDPGVDNGARATDSDAGCGNGSLL